MGPGEVETDADVLGSVATADHLNWRGLFAMRLWTEPSKVVEGDIRNLVRNLYDLNLVVPFNWSDWYSPDRYPVGKGLESASAADAVRLITSYVRGDRFCEGALVEAVRNDSMPAAIRRLWTWYRQAVASEAEYVDHAQYSSDGIYRWSYERRWAPGGTLCWVGLNPGTGDRDSGPRPTLRRVVGWARREGCAAVTVVNLFSYRSTDPRALRAAPVEIVGDRTDDTIRDASRGAQVTLAAWGANKIVKHRSREVVRMLINPMCVGVTKDGQPRHPLYVATSTPLAPYRPA
jgi:hypothetical protein